MDHHHPGSGTGAQHVVGASLVGESRRIELGTDFSSLTHPPPLSMTSEVIYSRPTAACALSRGSRPTTRRGAGGGYRDRMGPPALSSASNLSEHRKECSSRPVKEDGDGEDSVFDGYRSTRRGCIRLRRRRTQPRHVLGCLVDCGLSPGRDPLRITQDKPGGDAVPSKTSPRHGKLRAILVLPPGSGS